MIIFSIKLYVIKMPLKSPFFTHLGTVKEREGIIVKIMDADGYCGYGESVAFSSPWYTEETVKTSLHVMEEFLIPLLQNNTIEHPGEASRLFESIRGNNMAKAALETALWDLYAKRKGISLSELLGGTLKEIPAGVVVAADSIPKALSQIEVYVSEGYQRIKVKIHPGNDRSMLTEIRRHYPNLPIMADANSAYTLKDMDRIKALDEFNLMMIEQPLAHNDIYEHSLLQKVIQSPICLDESIHTFEDARLAVEMESCQVINIKVGRVGGLAEAKRIYDLCINRGIKVWVGGMIEFGVSRAHNIAFASLSGFSIPGDISASSRFWEEDIILPEVIVENGFVKVPYSSGLGFEINEKVLRKVTLQSKKFLFQN